MSTTENAPHTSTHRPTQTDRPTVTATAQAGSGRPSRPAASARLYAATCAPR